MVSFVSGNQENFVLCLHFYLLSYHNLYTYLTMISLHMHKMYYDAYIYMYYINITIYGEKKMKVSRIECIVLILLWSEKDKS